MRRRGATRQEAGGLPLDAGRQRVVIEGVTPEVDGGRYPIKRTVGEKVAVEADVFVDGHDALSCQLLYRREGESGWTESRMTHVVNDRWRGEFAITELGRYEYTLEAWVDPFETWRRDVRKKVDVGQDVSVELQVGAGLLSEARQRASSRAATRLQEWRRSLTRRAKLDGRVELALSAEVAELMARYPDKSFATRYEKELSVVVDPERARFSAWYEMFPRSASPKPGRHGTFEDVEARLPYIASMGFDVLYLPPIHPVGRTNRKGKNNSPAAKRSDVGSPWAIGSEKGGHKAIEPRLGTLAEFRRLLAGARKQGIEVALDLAFQCSPDHPYVKLHPEWFRWRPDGTLQYAENPPKKYEDIYPLNFETDHWQELWQELRSVVSFWLEQGVRVFRVDNPHTKPFAFWEWLIDGARREYPETIFLAEAFTRPKVMRDLAKVGFSQSYTYFTWRNTQWELTQYFTELTKGDAREYLRPNLWPNTPDILTEYLQSGGRAAFATRLVLAATLGANYGIYGPAFELQEHLPRELGSEEYLDSEKYGVRHWDIERPDSLSELIGRVNRIRRENAALQSDWSLQFHSVDNEQLICYSKQTEDREVGVITVVNLDPHHTQSGWVHLDLDSLGIDAQQPYQVHDLLSEARYLWHGPANYVELNPHAMPAHILRVRRRVRTEQDFDYYI